MDYTKSAPTGPEDKPLTVQELAQKWLETNRKNGSKNEPSEKAEALAASALAEEFWNWCKHPRSYSYSYIGSIDNHHNFKYLLRKLPNWKYTKQLTKLHLCHEYIISNPELTTLHISVNLSPSSEKRIKRTGDHSYAKDQIQKAIRKALGSQHPVLFWITDEYTRDKRRLHYHGCIGVANDLIATGIIPRLEKSLSETPLSRRYKVIGRNKKVHVSDTYTKKDNDVISPVNSGFLAYTLKSSGRLRDSNNKRIPPQICISNELRKSTDIALQELRRGLKGI